MTITEYKTFIRALYERKRSKKEEERQIKEISDDRKDIEDIIKRALERAYQLPVEEEFPIIRIKDVFKEARPGPPIYFSKDGMYRHR